MALVAKARTTGSADKFAVALADYDVHAGKEDWKAAISDARAMASAFMAETELGARFRSLYVSTQVTPLLADALAQSGDFAAAHSAIDATPADCYDCVRARGKIEGLQKSWSAAANWFADAVKQAPSIPFAYADWGQMLMAKGDLDGAITKFALAHQKGPQFADPLEMWGEALIAKNRSDLALAKFEEANKYAPKWGRLHLKWGEALYWSGDKAGAAKQFAIASRLDLTQSDKASLGRLTGHGGG
jgi:tetratricopeptide (TPR) repeat protein